MDEGFINRQEASFRGVPFTVKTVKGKGGRNALAHEYPKREEGWAEDNGRVLNNETIQAEFAGPDAEAEFAALYNALNVAGPGELVHPYFGRRQVQVGEVDYDLDNDVQYAASLSFRVYAVGNPSFPTANANTAQELEQSALAADDANTQQFESQTENLTSEQTQTLGETFDAMFDDLDNLVNGLPELPSELGEWVDRLNRAKWSASRLLANPGELARETTNLITDVRDLVTELPQALNVYEQMAQRWEGLYYEYNPENYQDEKSKQNAVVKRASYQHSLNTAVVAKTKAIANAPVVGEQGGFSHSGEVSDVQSQLSTQLLNLAEEAVESGNRDGWRTLRALRVSLSRDLSDRIANLPALLTTRPSKTTPVALLAYQLTGDTEQRNQVIARNQLSRPSFITPHQPIELIQEQDNG